MKKAILYVFYLISSNNWKFMEFLDFVMEFFNFVMENKNNLNIYSKLRFALIINIY